MATPHKRESGRVASGAQGIAPLGSLFAQSGPMRDRWLQLSAFFGRVAFSSFRVAESRARKYVNDSHHGADQPLNMTAKTRRRRRTVNELDSVFAASGFQCSRVKFRAVVAM